MESASFAAVRQVLTWAAEQGLSLRGLLDAEQLQALARVFDGQAPWRFELYEPLRAFSQAVPRLSLPDVPTAMHFGDALTALEELLQSRGPTWPAYSRTSPSVLAELGYEAASQGIERLHDAHRAAWREHALSNKELLLRGAEQASGQQVLVLGAGKLYDIPLERLAERFERVVLVDIDERALCHSVERAGLPGELRRRVTLSIADVTGSAETFSRKAHEAFDLAGETAVYQALLGLLHGYRLEQPPRLCGPELAETSFDFACSSLLLSQLATPFTQFLTQHFTERFPDSALIRSAEFRIALTQFTHRIEHAHIAALLATAPLVALTSDVAEHLTELDDHGNLNAEAPVSLIGAPHLEDLVPIQQARVKSSSEWSWNRVAPTRTAPHGVLLQVVGIIAERTNISQLPAR